MYNTSDAALRERVLEVLGAAVHVTLEKGDFWYLVEDIAPFSNPIHDF